MTTTPTIFSLALIERGPFGALVVQAAEPTSASPLGRILYANRAIAEWLGKAPSDLADHCIWDFCGDAEKPLRDAIETGGHTGNWPAELIHPFVHADGRRIFLRLRLAGDPLMATATGKHRHLLVFAEIVNMLDADFDRVEANTHKINRLALELKTAQATLTGLIGTLKGSVHEVVGNAVELARALCRKLADAADAEAEASASATVDLSAVPVSAVGHAQLVALRDLADHTLHATETADRLISNLVFHKEIQVGVREIRPVLVDLEDMLQDAVDAEQSACESKAQILEFEPPRNTVTFLADPMAIERLLTNLISNARKFTPRGGKIRIAGEQQSEVVVIRIEDTGTGIPPEYIPRLFDISGGPTTSRGTEAEPGIGFGLQICHDIVAAHAGVLLVESEPGVGSTFTVRIPLTPPTPTPS